MKDMWKAGIVVIVCLSVVFEIIPIFLLQNNGARTDDNGSNPPQWPPNDQYPPDDYTFPPIQDCERYNAFTSVSEIEQRVNDANYGASDPAVPGGIGWFGGPTLGPADTGSSQVGLAGDSATRDYSDTNIQVANVDEEDIVKTDGQYLYTISESDVVIIKAYPTDQAGIVSRIQFDPWPTGLFVSGDRLVVIGGYSYDTYWRNGYNYSEYSDDTHVTLVDIADRANPTILKEYAVDGGFAGARMVGGYAYILTTDFLYDYGYEFGLPSITVGSQTEELQPSQIGYFENDTSGNAVTIIFAIDAAGDGSHSVAGYMTGGFSVLYVSYEHMYIAVTIYDYSYDGMYYWNYEKTAIHKIAFNNLDTDYVCSGEVPGRLLNQFSMDEYNGNLRVATTVGQMGWGGSSPSNNVYVLDPDMALLGSVEDIAVGEQIYSCRFMGDRAYMVTYMRIDPFFVIDLSNPTDPSVMSYLEVPGFSDYLHPYGGNHVIGVGLDTIDDQSGNFGWFQGVKLSLFDVTDPANPVEEDKVVIGNRGSSSEVNTDHKSFMFDQERGILAMPVSVFEGYDEWQWNYSGSWQGVYVFHVSVDDGFQFIGRVTHGSTGQNYYYDDLYVRRSLYIEDVLYTVSQGMVKMNALSDLVEIGSIEL